MNNTRPRTNTDTSDRGSVTPLIIGMMLCLLLLGAGITAAGSAFLAGQRLQHLCDGAVAAAADTLTGPTNGSPAADTTVATYLATRNSQIATRITYHDTTVNLTCTTDTPITFGALFGTPTLHRTVNANARTNYTQG
ncbi:hypothetical protein ABIB25_001086 [Nakamurella sp. UYEF19]|uniref:pilus assembly protein TadG-related protein n=1 Tax=Nakamurella sp. UYEF19 TaxID=1756392 RepID=UPI00339192B0